MMIGRRVSLLTLDKQSLMPLHLQLRNLLKSEIDEAKYVDKIPTEFELMDKFGVSRSTVRQAIKTLVDDGMLEKKQGLGTFIAVRPIEEWLGNLSSFLDIVNEMGMKPGIRLLERGFTEEPEEIAATLGVEDQFYYIHRLRTADGVPLVYEKQYYPVKIGKALLCHTNHGRYLETLAAGGPRYALDGFEVGAVSLKERKRAAARLKRRGPEPEPDRLAMRLVRKIEGRQLGQACSKENPCKGELSDQMETRP